MTADADDRVYYVISDLHIGGDEQLEEAEFLDELVSFLQDLATTDENAELVINGDAFGLWEFTTADGIEKFDILTETYPELFAQFRATGNNIQITLLPGNHDHELAAYDAYVERFAAYNVTVVQEESLQRRVGNRVIHFEHGHQRDPNNRIDDWGNPHATPLGYYYNTLVTSRAGQLSDRGRYNWLKDVQAVTPTERMPIWLISKYFYREMNPVLRYSLVPFLLLFNVSAVLAVVAGLDLIGVWSLPVDRTAAFLDQFGRAGSLAWLLLSINVTVTGLLLLVGIPLYFIRRDARKTINRFGVFETGLTVDAEAPYETAAQELFESNPETAIFCYGHTHRPTITEIDADSGGEAKTDSEAGTDSEDRIGEGEDGVDGGEDGIGESENGIGGGEDRDGERLLVNTGTWLKRLHRRDGIIGILPPVFYPSYQLGTVRIAAESEGIAVEYRTVTKPSPATEELTLTERLFTVGREPESDVPERTVIQDAHPTPAAPETTVEGTN